MFNIKYDLIPAKLCLYFLRLRTCMSLFYRGMQKNYSRLDIMEL